MKTTPPSTSCLQVTLALFVFGLALAVTFLHPWPVAVGSTLALLNLAAGNFVRGY